MLKQDMRKLWTDHVVWTRDYIVAAVDDKPDARAAANRLMKNQDDIGAAVGRYYGAVAGQQLTMLLKAHILIAVDLIAAAKAGDKAAQQQADDKWQQNGVAIADFLSNANPNCPCVRRRLRSHPDDVGYARGWNRQTVPGEVRGRRVNQTGPGGLRRAR